MDRQRENSIPANKHSLRGGGGGIIKETLYDILNDEILFQLYENNNYVINMGFGVKHF